MLLESPERAVGNRRFTRDGSDALERRIADDMRKVRAYALEAAGKHTITALVLGGGYGRGEGGVYVNDGEERPYNDYDFLVIVPFTSHLKRHALSRRLLDAKARLEPQCGIHVDFGSPIPAAHLPHYPYTQMLMEAREGHQVIYGPSNALLDLPAYNPARPPLEEGARLFMNRGVGLMSTAALLRKRIPLTREEHEFAVRNIHKAVLALGDGVLMACRAYHTHCVVRQKTLSCMDPSRIPERTALLTAYDRAVAFKLRPSHTVPDDGLSAWHAQILDLFGKIFLWFEQYRLRRPNLTWAEYMALPTRLSGPEPANVLRHWISGTARRASAREWALHPRDVILKHLPEVLFSAPKAELEQRIRGLWERYG
jgi:hypothetical protein